MAQSLIQSLQGVRRRWKTLTIAFGVGIVLTATVLVILATVFIDYLLNLPSVPRFIVILAALGTIGYAAYRWIVRPALARLSISDVAGRLEHAFPQFDDRLRSTVDFVRTDLPGSEVMKDRVVKETTTMAGQIDLNRAVMLRPVLYALGAGFGAVVLICGLSMIDKQFTAIAFSHLIHPFTSDPWPKRVDIAMDYLPDRVAMSQPISVSMHLTRGFKSGATAIVHYQYDNGPEQQEMMTLGDDHEFTASLDARGQKLKVWTESGDDTTTRREVTILPRLEIGHIEALVTPPAYAKLPPVTLSLDAGPAIITVGSQVQMHVLFNKPLDSSKLATLEAVGKDVHLPKIAWTHGELGGEQITGQWLARDSFAFHVHATDTDGFTNTAMKDFEFIVRPDQNPTVQIETPRGNLDCSNDASIPLAAMAEDDFGIKSAKLLVDRLGDKKHWEIDLTDTLRRVDSAGDLLHFHIDYSWDLSKLADASLKPGDVLEYCVQVRDNFELPAEDGSSQPQTHAPAFSQHFRLNIYSKEDLQNQALQKLQQLAEQTTQVRKSQDNVRAETQQVQDETAKKPQLSKGDQAALERLVNQQSDVIAAQTKTLANEVAQVGKMLEQNKIDAPDLKNLTKDVTAELNQAAEQPMKQAATDLTHAQQQSSDPKSSPEQKKKTTDQRNSDLNQGQQSQQEASAALKNAIDKMGSASALSQAMKNFQAILDKQQKVGEETRKVAEGTLGKTPDQLSQQEKQDLNKINKDQQDLAKQTDQATQAAQQAAQQLQKSNPTASQALSQASQQSQQSQISGNQSNAGQQAQQNQQQQAQNSQQQAELGLQQVLDKLKDAQKAELAKLQTKLDQAAQVLQDLIRRQAGHNVDDLILQNKQKSITDDLLTLAGHDKAKPIPAAALPQLTASQEQTERNTRDLTKLADDLPGGADISGLLIRASRRMSDAIIDLRDEKLADAYDPNMVEALSALQDAAKKVEEQRQAVAQKMNDKKKEAIRQAYIRIKEDQDKLNALVKTIDGGRLPSGQYRRVDQLRITDPKDGALPTQASLADRCKALDDDLRSLDSIVYRWANNDIVKSMLEVKDDLNKPETGVPTQSEQQRISDQLAAMIDDLKQTPPKKPEFEKDPSGGGGGGGGGSKKPTLPTEAELRLMRDLEIAIKKDTTTQGTLPAAQKDNQKLVDLGSRQGQLRNLLDQLLKAAGNPGLPPPPDKSQKLPEEANDAQVADKEFADMLLNSKKVDDKADNDLKLLGDRMSVTDRRLRTDLDPGKTTQIIEDHIVKGLSDLIKLAQQQQQQNSSSSASSGQGQPKPGGSQPANSQGQGAQSQMNHSVQGATSDNISSANENNAHDLNKDIKQRAAEWGGVSPRTRQAVTESAGEQVIDKYRQLVDDYYRALSIKATEDKK